MQATGAQVAQGAIDGMLQRIDALAAKIGTTAQAIWQVYVAQSRVEAVRDTFIAIIFLVTAIVLFGFGKKCWAKNEENWQIGAVAVYVVSVGAVLICMFWAYAAIGEWLNPQYWAFQHLTADLKGLL